MERTAALLAMTLVVGCAVGVTESAEGLDDGSGGAVITGVGGSSSGSSSPPTSTSPSSSSSGGMGGMSAGMGGMSAGMGGAGGGGMMCDFTHTETCATAEGLGNLAGDENNPPVIRSGVSSRWYQIRITEEVGSIFGEDLSYTVTLTSAAGMDYDLIIHQGEEDGPPNCNATPKMGIDQGGGVETVSDSWHDDQGIGGEDDPVWLSIEVRYVSGTGCTAAEEFTLRIQGHT